MRKKIIQIKLIKKNNYVKVYKLNRNKSFLSIILLILNIIVIYFNNLIHFEYNNIVKFMYILLMKNIFNEFKTKLYIKQLRAFFYFLIK